MNRIGIIGAMQIEIDLLLEKLAIQEKQTIAGMPFYVGEIHGNGSDCYKMWCRESKCSRMYAKR